MSACRGDIVNSAAGTAFAVRPGWFPRAVVGNAGEGWAVE
jgi:hypothetical protein